MTLAPDFYCKWKWFNFGGTFYSYQISLGITFRYWADMRMPNIRIHIGPFKIWFGVSLKSLKEGQ